MLNNKCLLWCALAIENESMVNWSIGPLDPKLWPCKGGNRQMNFTKFESFGQISSIHVQMLRPRMEFSLMPSLISLVYFSPWLRNQVKCSPRI